MTRRNQIALGVILAVVAALVAWALRPQPILVEVLEVTKGVFEQTVSDDGQTRVRDRYVIAAPLAGQVERIQLEVGDPVKQGQVVAELTPTAPAFLDVRTQRELRERIGAAEAQVARARGDLEDAGAARPGARRPGPPGPAVEGGLHLADGARAGGPCSEDRRASGRCCALCRAGGGPRPRAGARGAHTLREQGACNKMAGELAGGRRGAQGRAEKRGSGAARHAARRSCGPAQPRGDSGRAVAGSRRHPECRRASSSVKGWKRSPRSCA